MIFLGSFRVRLALLIGALVLACTGTLSWWLGNSMSREIGAEQGRALREIARNVGFVLGDEMDARLHEIRYLAGDGLSLYAGSLEGVDDSTMDRIATLHGNYSWIGLADAQGRVLAAKQGLLSGKDVSQRDWFQHALKGAFVGDVHQAKLLAALLPAPDSGEPLRFIDFAAPVADGAGRPVAVLGAHVSWELVGQVIAAMRSEDARQHGVRVFVVNAKGEVIHRPAELRDATDLRAPALARLTQPVVLHWSDGVEYLSAAAPVSVRDPLNRLGWTIVVRQPLDVALAPAHTAQRGVWWAGVLVALATMVAAWWMAGRFSRPLTAIHDAAQRIEGGALDTPIPQDEGAREVRALGVMLARMTRALLARERALRLANETLEARVAERTAELAKANANLETLALSDALTGLANRRAADQRLAEEMGRHRRHRHALTVMMVDIDHFKSVNDNHGHATGDLVLMRVAEVMGATVRGTDFLARLGGEEFMVLLPETGPPDAAAVAEKLRAAVADAPMPVGRVTVSIGVASPAEGHADAGAALAAADAALYDAKRAGRNRVVTA